MGVHGSRDDAEQSQGFGQLSGKASQAFERALGHDDEPHAENHDARDGDGVGGGVKEDGGLRGTPHRSIWATGVRVIEWGP